MTAWRVEEPEPISALEKGIVLTSYGSRGIVALESGVRLACKYRRSVGRPICGDRVITAMTGDREGMVEEILPRDNVFARADSRQRKQLVASNLDQVLIVIAPQPEPSLDLIERYLVASHSLGVNPALVLNKAELHQASTETQDPQPPLARLESYSVLGYPLATTSCKGPPGIGAMQDLLHNRTSILAGQSGVGKSSLINGVIPDLDLQTGALSRATGKGIHTTTTTTMYSLPDGGDLIDSPGVWEYGLWQLSQPELEQGFIDFLPHLGQCRFNNCVHKTEPDCAVKEAVEAGEIRPWRHHAYLRLLSQSC